LPYAAVLPVAYLAEGFAKISGRSGRVTLEGVRMSRKRMFFSSGKAVSELGYRWRPPLEAFEDAVRWFSRTRSSFLSAAEPRKIPAQSRLRATEDRSFPAKAMPDQMRAGSHSIGKILQERHQPRALQACVVTVPCAGRSREDTISSSEWSVTDSPTS